MAATAWGAAERALGLEERYVADGKEVRLIQDPGEVVVRQQDSDRAGSISATFTVGTVRFDLDRELGSGRVLYRSTSQGRPSPDETAQASANADPAIQYAFPVFINPDTGRRHFLSDELVVCLRAPIGDAEDVFVDIPDLELVETLSGSTHIYVFRFKDPKNANPFAMCADLRAKRGVAWAEPNMGQEVQTLVYPPTDSLLPNEWYVDNIGAGQTGARSGADVKALAAWTGDRYGSKGIRIAIIDDGVETTHADLAANIVPGYDFYDNDTDPNPATANDNHGTTVAGLAAAVVDNNQGVTGIAGGAKILPVKAFRDGMFSSASAVYRAFVYAADNADVVNCSWAMTASSTISAGIQYAAQQGRGGKGCPVLAAVGNSASGAGPLSYDHLEWVNVYQLVGAGLYYLEFSYEKDASVAAGDDAVWVADVYAPVNGYAGLSAFTFDNGWQTWTPGGNANWQLLANDPAHAHGTSRYAVKSGAIADNQKSTLTSPLLNVTAGNPYVFFRRWGSSDPSDKLYVNINNQGGSRVAREDHFGGQVTGRDTAVSYPANNYYATAVGASTDWDYRSDYSAFGSTLAFLAPSGGGYSTPSGLWPLKGVATTDRTGTAGYVDQDYVYSDGTSCSAPIGCGVAALVLSKNGNLSRSQVLSKLNENCSKIGPVAYAGTAPLTRNDYYGYGRLDAQASLSATTADTTAPGFTLARSLHYRAVDVTFSEPMGEGATDPTKYQIIAGQGTLSTSPSKVLRITPAIYRLIWDSGDMAVSGTVTIKVLTGVKDVAGNPLPANVTQSSTGTKRIIGLNCGNQYMDNTGLVYAPPYFPDHWPFQGNEFLANFLGNGGVCNYYPYPINVAGVTDPAPQLVYQTSRRSYTAGVSLQYSIPNVPAGTKNVRLHFAEVYYPRTGDQIFDIRINGSVVYAGYDILGHTQGRMYYAVTQTFTGVTPDANGVITLQLTPVGGVYWTASVNAIEVLKP